MKESLLMKVLHGASPILLSPHVCAADQEQPSGSSGFQMCDVPSGEQSIPVPIPATTEQVDEWVATSFKQLTNISTKCPPEIGETVLWKGVKRGRGGNPSGKCEYFNGTVRNVQVEEDLEIYVYID